MNNHPLLLTTFIVSFVESQCIGILDIRPMVQGSLIGVQYSKFA